jgi:DNA-binding GntR family transcriptional regulator
VGSLLLYIERVSYTQSGEPIECLRFLH